MEPEENRISVWICREEKLVSGLSRRTTCADVIRVLLEERGSAAYARAHSLVEKWRGSERVLPRGTRIMRLWNAWGAEQPNVRFVLVRSEASEAGGAPRSAEARVVLSRESPRAPLGPPCATGGAATAGTGADTGADATSATATLSRERQRRIVRKAFRKLERMNRRRARALAAKDARAAERMETLVHAVVSRDHTVRQQLRRLEELDAEIERHEARVHLDRVRAHGANYVQDTYLARDLDEQGQRQGGAGAGDDDSDRADGGDGDGNGGLVALRLQELADRCEELLRLHDELTERENLAAELTGQIEEELNNRWMERRRRCVELTVQEPPGPEDSLLEEEQVRTELDTSLYIGLRLNTDLEAVRKELDLSEEIWEARDKELRDLLEKVDSLELEKGDEDEEEVEEEEEVCSLLKDSVEPDLESPGVASTQSPSGWLEQARGLSKTCNSNDEDSDTGLSSMHSQDSDSAPVCESLV